MRYVWCHSRTHFLSIVFLNPTIKYVRPTCELHKFNGEFTHILYENKQKLYKRMKPNAPLFLLIIIFFSFNVNITTTFGTTQMNPKWPLLNGSQNHMKIKAFLLKKKKLCRLGMRDIIKLQTCPYDKTIKLPKWTILSSNRKGHNFAVPAVLKALHIYRRPKLKSLINLE